MPICVPIKDLRDTSAFAHMVETSPTPVVVTKNGYDRFVCLRSEEFNRWEQAEARARLLERMLVAEHEFAEGLGEDAFEATARLKEKYGL